MRPCSPAVCWRSNAFGMGASEYTLGSPGSDEGLVGKPVMLEPNSIHAVALLEGKGGKAQAAAVLALGVEGLWLLDMRDPIAPRVRAKLPLWFSDNNHARLPGSDSSEEGHNPLLPIRIRTVGTLAYISLYGGGTAIVDLNDPDAPRLRGHIASIGATDIVVRGDTAYITDRGGLLMVDVSDPDQPHVLSHMLQIASEKHRPGIVVAGDRAYVLVRQGHPSGYEVLELDLGPENNAIIPPQVVGRADITDRPAGMEVVDDRLYIGTDSFLVSFDLTAKAPLSEEPTTNLSSDGDSFDSVTTMGSTDDGLLLIRDRFGLHLLDPRSGEHRLFSGTPPEAIEPFTSFAADSGVVYIAGGTNGLTVHGVDER